MDILEKFPSPYLKASDLQGKEVRVKINRVGLEDIGGEKKPVIYFEDKQKGLVSNKTNAVSIARQYGNDTDRWEGCGIILYPTFVDFRGERIETIRVKIPPRADVQARLSEENPPPNMGEDLDDAIPF